DPPCRVVPFSGATYDSPAGIARSEQYGGFVTAGVLRKAPSQRNVADATAVPSSRSSRTVRRPPGGGTIRRPQLPWPVTTSSVPTTAGGAPPAPSSTTQV